MDINGGPAFQHCSRCGENANQRVAPLLAAIDLRDYFAAKAMHALMVEPPWGDGGTAMVHSWSKGFKGSDSCDRFAFAAYAMADAMLAARQPPDLL